MQTMTSSCRTGSRHAGYHLSVRQSNPTGACYKQSQLKWVDYALKNQAVILLMRLIEAFVSDPELPKYLCRRRAKQCAIEFCSLSNNKFTEPDVDIRSFRRNWYLQRPQERDVAQCHVEQTSVHKIQWYFLYWPQKAATVFSRGRYPSSVRRIWEYYRRMRVSLQIHFQILASGLFERLHSPYVWFECPRTWIPGRF